MVSFHGVQPVTSGLHPVPDVSAEQWALWLVLLTAPWVFDTWPLWPPRGEVTWPLVRVPPAPSQRVSDADRDVTAGRCAAFDARAARSGFRLTAAQRAQQQPEVEDDTGPAGRHLNPEGRPAAVGEGGLQHCWFVAGGGQHSVTPCLGQCLESGQRWLG